jgi:hypothetical protein
MTTDLNQIASEPASVSLGFPVTVGWTHAAIAIHSMQRLDSPVNMRMQIEMHGPLLIDLRHHAFSWDTPLDLFPEDAVHTGLETESIAPDAPPYFELPGQDLDGLLWQIGINSFGGARARWLPPDERYRLTRWPNITRQALAIHQMQMMAVLGNTYANTAELAALAGTDESEAIRLINAMSLMGILHRSVDAPAAPVVKQTAAVKRQSLFARLRKRLAR